MIDLYIPRKTRFHTLDPRVKLVAVVCSLLILFLAKNLLLMLAVLLLTHGCYWAAHIPRSNLVAVWKTLLPIGAFVGLLWILFYPTGTPLLQFWIFTITSLSIAQGLVLALRILNLGLIISLWLYTTDSVAIVQSLVKLGIPYAWGLVLALALRYIPFMQESYSTISEAQQARGLDISKGNGLARARAMLPIFIAMMINALRASYNVARALEARGFGANTSARTSLYPLEATAQDYAITFLILFALVIFLVMNLFWGFASQAVSIF